jgi:hypothetical protein
MSKEKIIAILVVTGTLGTFLVSAAVTCTNTFPTSLNGYTTGQCIPSTWANALEAKIGINSSSVTSTLDYKVSHVATGSIIGLGTAAYQATSAFLQVANNGSDITNTSSFRNILGLTDTAITASSTFLKKANNLSDLTSTSSARTTLGLGAFATQTAPCSVAQGCTGTTTAPIDGQYLGASSTNPTWKNFVAGNNVTITNTPTSTIINSSASGGSTITMTAGTGLNNQQAVFVAPTTVSTLEYQNVTSTVGANSANACLFPRSTITGDQASACAQRFSTSTTITVTAVTDYAKIGAGSPAGNLILEIVPDNSGVPSTTILASTTITNANITGTCKGLANTLNSSVSLTGGSIYWLIATSTTAASDTNYWSQCGVGTVSKTPVSARLFQSGVWNTEGDIGDYQISVDVTTSTTAGQVYPASAYGFFTYATSTNSTSSYSESNSFLGFTNATTTQGNTVTIVTGGAATVPSVTIGAQYYLDSTIPAAGTVTSTAPTIARKVCIATSVTQCLVTNIW